MRYQKELVRASIRKMIIEKAQEAFDLSQMFSPVKTGNLKRSGKVIVLPESIEIRYSALYAHIIETGQKEQTIYVPPGISSHGTPRTDYVYNRKAVQGMFFVKKAIDQAFSTVDKDMDNLTTSGFKLVR